MFNLQVLFGGDPLPLHLIGVGTVAYVLILGYYKGQSRKVQTLVLTRR